jgi:hypothetical protein
MSMTRSGNRLQPTQAYTRYGNFEIDQNWRYFGFSQYLRPFLIRELHGSHAQLRHYFTPFLTHKLWGL